MTDRAAGVGQIDIRDRAGAQVLVLDGDILRAGPSADLGFGPTDRREQLRRVRELARLGLAQGHIVLVAVIAPDEEGRRWACAQFAAQDFMLIHCRCSLSACVSRDPKGHYAQARIGVLPAFTGVSAPYEHPPAPDLVVDTEHESVAACITHIVQLLRRQGVWAPEERVPEVKG